MVKASLVVLTALVLSGALLRLYGWSTRQRTLRKLDASRIQRMARGVSLRVKVHGSGVLPGMKHGTNRTRGDLALTDDTFVITTTRGPVAWLAPNRGRKLTSVRCPGPGRLIIEGDRPGVDGPRPWRVEVMLEDASQWARALRPFVASSS